MPGNIIYIHLADGNIQVPIMPEGYAFLYDVNTQRATAPTLDTYSGGIADRRLIILPQESKNSALTFFDEVMRRYGFPQGKYIVNPINFLTEVGFALKEGETVCNAVIKGSTVLLFNAVLLPILPLQIIMTASHLSRLIEIPDNATRSIPLIFCLNPLGFDPDPITMIRAIQAPSRIMDMAMQSFNHLIIKAKDYAFSDYPLSQNTLPPGPLVGSALPAILFQQRMQLFPESTLQNLITVHKQVFGEAFDFTAFPSQLTPVLTGPSSAINPLALIPEGIKPKSVFETNSFMRNLKELTSRIHLNDSDRIEIQVNSDGSFDVTIGTKAISAIWSRSHGFQQKKENIDNAQTQFQKTETEYTNALAEAVSKLNAGDPTALDAVHRATQKQGQRKQGLQQLKHAFGKLNKTTLKIHKHGKEARKQATQGIEQCNRHKETVMRDDALLLSLETAAHVQKDDLAAASTRVQRYLRRDPTNPVAKQLAKHIQSQQLTEQTFAELSAGHFAKANEQAQEALHFNPDNTAAQNLLSVAQSCELTEEAFLLLATDRMAAFERSEEALEYYANNPSAEIILRTTWRLFYTDLVSHIFDLLLPKIGPKFFSESTTKILLESTHIVSELIRTTTRFQELVELGGIQATPKAWVQQLGTPATLSIAISALNIASFYVENQRLKQAVEISHLASIFFNRSGNDNLFHSSLTMLDSFTFTTNFAANTVGEYLPEPIRNILYDAASGSRLLQQLRSRDPILTSMDALALAHKVSKSLYQSYPTLFQRQVNTLLPKIAKTTLTKIANAPVLNLLIPHSGLIATIAYSVRLTRSVYALNMQVRVQRQRFQLHSHRLSAISIITDVVSREFFPNTKTFNQLVGLVSTVMQPTLMDAIHMREGFFAIHGMSAALNGDNPYSISAIRDTLFRYKGWHSINLWVNLSRFSLPLTVSLGLLDPSSRIYKIQPYLEYTSMGFSFYDTTQKISSFIKLNSIERMNFLHSPDGIGLLRTGASLVSFGLNCYESTFSNDDLLHENPIYLFLKSTSDSLSEDPILGLYYAATFITSSINPFFTGVVAINLVRSTRNRYLFTKDFNQLFNLIKKRNYKQAMSKIAPLREFNPTWNSWVKRYKQTIDYTDFFLKLVDEDNLSATEVRHDIFTYLKTETLAITQECQFSALASDAFIKEIQELIKEKKLKEAENKLKDYNPPPGLQPACVSPHFVVQFDYQHFLIALYNKTKTPDQIHREIIQYLKNLTPSLSVNEECQFASLASDAFIQNIYQLISTGNFTKAEDELNHYKSPPGLQPACVSPHFVVQFDYQHFLIALYNKTKTPDQIHREIIQYLKNLTPSLSVNEECQFASLASDAFIQNIYQLISTGNFKKAEDELNHYKSPPGLQPACVSPHFVVQFDYQHFLIALYNKTKTPIQIHREIIQYLKNLTPSLSVNEECQFASLASDAFTQNIYQLISTGNFTKAEDELDHYKSLPGLQPACVSPHFVAQFDYQHFLIALHNKTKTPDQIHREIIQYLKNLTPSLSVNEECQFASLASDAFIQNIYQLISTGNFIKAEDELNHYKSPPGLQPACVSQHFVTQFDYQHFLIALHNKTKTPDQIHREIIQYLKNLTPSLSVNEECQFASLASDAFMQDIHDLIRAGKLKEAENKLKDYNPPPGLQPACVSPYFVAQFDYQHFLIALYNKTKTPVQIHSEIAQYLKNLTPTLSVNEECQFASLANDAFMQDIHDLIRAGKLKEAENRLIHYEPLPGLQSTCVSLHFAAQFNYQQFFLALYNQTRTPEQIQDQVLRHIETQVLSKKEKCQFSRLADDAFLQSIQKLIRQKKVKEAEKKLEEYISPVISSLCDNEHTTFQIYYLKQFLALHRPESSAASKVYDDITHRINHGGFKKKQACEAYRLASDAFIIKVRQLIDEESFQAAKKELEQFANPESGNPAKEESCPCVSDSFPFQFDYLRFLLDQREKTPDIFFNDIRSHLESKLLTTPEQYSLLALARLTLTRSNGYTQGQTLLTLTQRLLPKSERRALEEAFIHFELLDNLTKAEELSAHIVSEESDYHETLSPNAYMMAQCPSGWESLNKQIEFRITRRKMFLADIGFKALRIGLNHRSLPSFLPDTAELTRELFVNYFHRQFDSKNHDHGFEYRVANTIFTIVSHLLPNSNRKIHFSIRTVQTVLEFVFLYQSFQQIYGIATGNENGGITNAVFSLQSYFVFMHLMAIAGYCLTVFSGPTNYFKNLFGQLHQHLQDNRAYRCFSYALTPYTIYRLYPDLPLLLSAGPYFAELNNRLPWLENAFIFTRNSLYQANFFMMRSDMPWLAAPWLAATVSIIFCCRSIRKSAIIEQPLLEQCEAISQLTREGKYDEAYSIVQEVNESNFQIQSNRRYFNALKAFTLLYKTNPEPLAARKIIYPILRQYQDSQYDEIYYTLLRLATLAIFKLQDSAEPSTKKHLRCLAYQAKRHCEHLIAHEPDNPKYVEWKGFTLEMIKLNKEEASLPSAENHHRWAKPGFFERQSQFNDSGPTLEIVEENGSYSPLESITHSYPFSMQHRFFRAISEQPHQEAPDISKIKSLRIANQTTG